MSGDCGPFVPMNANGPGGGGGGGGIRSIAGSTTLATGPLVSLVNSNNVSFGVSGNTITAVAPYQLLVAGGTVPPGSPTTLASTQALYFDQANSVGFGLSTGGSTIRVSATITAIKRISAGTTALTANNCSFVNSNGVSFGVDAGGISLTASVAAGATATGNLGAISAAGSSVSGGTVVFSNSNGMSFGMNGSTVTAAQAPWLVGVDGFFGGVAVSMNATASSMYFSNLGNVWGGTSGPGTLRVNLISGPITVSAGTQTMAGGSLVFSNANGVSFGMSGSTVTASATAAKVSYFDNQVLPNETFNIFFASRTLFQRVAFAHPIDATQMDLVMSWNSGTTNNSSTNVTLVIGVYTLTGSTASQVSSFSTNLTTAGISASSLRTFPVNFAFSNSEYWIGIGFTASGVPILGGQLLNMWSAVNLIPSFGDALVTGGSNPASIHLSQQAANPQGRAGLRFWGS